MASFRDVIRKNAGRRVSPCHSARCRRLPPLAHINYSQQLHLLKGHTQEQLGTLAPCHQLTPGKGCGHAPSSCQQGSTTVPERLLPPSPQNPPLEGKTKRPLVGGHTPISVRDILVLWTHVGAPGNAFNADTQPCSPPQQAWGSPQTPQGGEQAHHPSAPWAAVVRGQIHRRRMLRRWDGMDGRPHAAAAPSPSPWGLRSVRF